ncbi:hypothetical protein BHE90_005559 [Fusarium euwallaceae]|uniref:Uncharacterized protein n=1 Tax=Fusarium euwallaceae TaxID=1147111 RepID=A0A430LVZ8_9HYPO|nr:hypothetical protein BHE90_005559 [Fusarium euwallaceae]
MLRTSSRAQKRRRSTSTSRLEVMPQSAQLFLDFPSFTRNPSWARHDREWHGMALIARLHRAWVGETWTG